jgi:hypothetical protein
MVETCVGRSAVIDELPAAFESLAHDLSGPGLRVLAASRRSAMLLAGRLKLPLVLVARLRLRQRIDEPAKVEQLVIGDAHDREISACAATTASGRPA